MGWRVLLGLTFKRLDYEVVYLSGSDNEHKHADFLQKNPHGKVPVLEFDGVFRRESLAILGWLDEQFSQNPLFGASTDETSKVWTTAARHSDYLLKATNDVVFPVFNGEDGVPKTGAEGRAGLDQACGLLRVELAELERHLIETRFLCGDTPSAADAVAFPDVGRIVRAMQTRPWSMSDLAFENLAQDFPNLARWRDRIAALPGYSRTVPPHWDDHDQKRSNHDQQ